MYKIILVFLFFNFSFSQTQIELNFKIKIIIFYAMKLLIKENSVIPLMSSNISSGWD